MSMQLPGPVPHGLIWEDRGHELRVAWRWINPATYFLIAWSVFWNVAMVVALLSGGGWFLTGHVLAGVVVGIHTLRSALNRTEVMVGPNRLSVRSGPIRLFVDDVDIDPHQVQQLFVRATKGSKGKSVRVYEVHAITGPQYSDVRLVGNLQSLKQAHFIERQFERYLEIQDQRTGHADEIPRPHYPPPPRPGIAP